MVLGHVHNPKVVIMNYEEKMKKLLKIIFLFFLVTYGCFILNIINVWIFKKMGGCPMVGGAPKKGVKPVIRQISGQAKPAEPILA